MACCLQRGVWCLVLVAYCFLLVYLKVPPEGLKPLDLESHPLPFKPQAPPLSPGTKHPGLCLCFLDVIGCNTSSVERAWPQMSSSWVSIQHSSDPGTTDWIKMKDCMMDMFGKTVCNHPQPNCSCQVPNCIMFVSRDIFLTPTAERMATHESNHPNAWFTCSFLSTWPRSDCGSQLPQQFLEQLTEFLKSCPFQTWCVQEHLEHIRQLGKWSQHIAAARVLCSVPTLVTRRGSVFWCLNPKMVFASRL